MLQGNSAVVTFLRYYTYKQASYRCCYDFMIQDDHFLFRYMYCATQETDLTNPEHA